MMGDLMTLKRKLHPALKQVPKQVIKDLLAGERRRRRSGDWGPWERVENPHRFGPGWLGQVDHVKKNKVFSVLIRDVGSAIHLGVSSLSGERPTFHEMQRIKNELAGQDVTAVEVYPPHAELVDDADMFHLWIVPRLPFSLFDRPALETGTDDD